MSDNDVDLFLNEGNRHFGLKQFDQAIYWYSKALAEQPSAFVYLNRAQAYLELDRNEKAFLDAKMALKWAPDNFKAIYCSGVALLRLGDLELAKEMFKKCAEQEPEENKDVEIKLNEIKQMLALQGNSKKCAKTVPMQILINKIRISCDTWRQVFPFIGPAERTNVGPLNKEIWCTFWDHYFARGKKRLSRHLIYVRNPQSGEEQFLVKETFGHQFHVLPIADTAAPPNIVGLDLCIQARPGKKLLNFLTLNKHFLTNFTLKFECLNNFISTVPDDQFREQFMKLFEKNHFLALWIQEANRINRFPQQFRANPMHSTYDADHKAFVEECKNFNRIALYGPINNAVNGVRMDFLLQHLHIFRSGRPPPLRLLTLDDDWLPQNELHGYRSRLIAGMPPDTFEGLNVDAEFVVVEFCLNRFNNADVPSKYAVSMQKMHRHKGGQFKFNQVNNLGEVLDLSVHRRNGMECLLLRRCPFDDLEKDYMHPDHLFAHPAEGEEFASRIMVAGIDDDMRMTSCKLRTHLPRQMEPSTELRAYNDLCWKPNEKKLKFEEMPRFYYFDFINRKWIKRERPFNSVEVFI